MCAGADTIAVGSVLGQTLQLWEVCWGRYNSCGEFAGADAIVVGSVLGQTQ